MKEEFKHNPKNAIIFGDHWNDSLSVEKIPFVNTLSMAFINFSAEEMDSIKKEQLEIYKKQWDILMYDESDFEFAISTLKKIVNYQ